MSKITNALNQIWHEQVGERINFGFTRNFLDTLDECWHILPAGTTTIKAKAPLMSVETNDSLVSIIAPVGGNFLEWNDRASNMPDKLTENDVILTLTTAKVARNEALVGDNINDVIAQMQAARDEARLRGGAIPRPGAVRAEGRTTPAPRFFADQWAVMPDPFGEAPVAPAPREPF